jgi:DNA polymerase-4
MNRNSLKPDTSKVVLFLDMNSFFASCEQQVNYWLRGRPVGVCVYTGRNGCIIAPSIEAKKKGIKTGMRLHEAMKICPDLVPVETHPARYREFHIKIMNVLRKYSAHVVPRSIDEAVVDLTEHMLIYKNPEEVARRIKRQIFAEVGDWLKCSIGIAPNAFLAKLASSLKKPDGLMVITPENIDDVLRTVSLRDLPGIGEGMAERLLRAGINTPVEMRYASPEKLKAACKSIAGLYWHYRLNFSEVDLMSHDYKSMSAMRHISAMQRESKQFIEELLLALCMTLEKRMVKQNVFCKDMSVFFNYEDGSSWKDYVHSENPVQDGTKILNYLKLRIKAADRRSNENIINTRVTALGVVASNFINGDLVQYDLFENNVREHNLRKAVYELKDKFGNEKIIKAVQLQEEVIYQDVIGFGSIGDLHEGLNESGF